MSASSRSAGSADDELSLRFLFANHDGVQVVLRFPKATPVAEVKAQLLRHWPDKVSATEDPKAVRLICMGRGLLQDGQTLAAAQIPGFPTHPTPVNVSVLRRSQPQVHDAAVAQTTVPKEVASANCGCCVS